jgi:hypothetical protein
MGLSAMTDYEKELENLKQLCADGIKWPYVWEGKTKQFLLSPVKVGEIVNKVSDLILFHNRVRENAEKRNM